MKSPFLNFILLVVSLAITATGATIASGQITLLTVGLIFLGGYGLGVTFPSFWARLRGVRTSSSPARAPVKRDDRSSRRKGGRRGSERPQRNDRSRNDGNRSERKERGGEKRSRPKRGKKAVRSVGTVKWFDESKGYGFITPEQGGEDCFVHKSVLPNDGSLVEGGKVEFEITKDDRGRVAATNVVPL